VLPSSRPKPASGLTPSDSETATSPPRVRAGLVYRRAFDYRPDTSLDRGGCEPAKAASSPTLFAVPNFKD
jgi:hypothetical protein